jgi:hypothetical protein
MRNDAAGSALRGAAIPYDYKSSSAFSSNITGVYANTYKRKKEGKNNAES